MESALKRSLPLFVPSFTGTEKGAIEQVIADGYLNEGKYVRQAEKDFARIVGSDYCIMVPNGALALWLGMQSYLPHSIFPRRETCETRRWEIPDYYGIFAANATLMCQLNVELLDVDRDTATLTKGSGPSVLSIHANGRHAATKDILIEDSCQAITLHTRHKLSCFSFHSTKIVTGGGILGAVCCDKKIVYEELYAVKDHGRPERAQDKKVTDRHNYWGTNLKVSDINCAFLSEQLKDLNNRLSRFHRNYLLYRDLLGSQVEWLEDEPQWRIDCLVKNPDFLISELAKNGIQAQRFYYPTHLQPMFNKPRSEFPNTEYLYDHGLYLPSSDNLGEGDIHYVCDSIKEVLKNEH